MWNVVQIKILYQHFSALTLISYFSIHIQLIQYLTGEGPTMRLYSV